MKIGTKIFTLVGFCLFLLVATSGVSIWQMNKIGVEIEAIAQRDLPLTEGLMNITIHQLEQAVNFERAFRAAEIMDRHHEAKAEYQKAIKTFKRLSTKIKKEFAETEALVETALKNSHTKIEREEFKHVGELLIKLDARHNEYDHASFAAFKLVNSGNLETALTKIAKIELVEEELDHFLKKLLREVEKFTATAATTAEHHEKFAIKLLLAITIASLIFGIVVSYLLVTRNITRPLEDIVTGLNALNSDDLSVEVKVYNRDEIGEVATAYATFRENMTKIKILEAENKEKTKAEAERQAAMTEATNDFVADISEIVATVSTASVELNATARSMTDISEETSTKSSVVATAYNQTSSNLQAVASAAQEMSASIGDINEQVAIASDIARRAVTDVADTSNQMTSLAETTQNIGDVVSLISDIAEQTNLLALNATIESARAGDAGKGFAVVASEVKALANETAKATEGISELIQEVQTKTKTAVTSIASIGKIIQEIETSSTAIAAAMEEQSVANQEISRNIDETSSGTNEISQNITGLSEASQKAALTSDQVSSAADMLSKNSEVLKVSVDNFIHKIKAA